MRGAKSGPRERIAEMVGLYQNQKLGKGKLVKSWRRLGLGAGERNQDAGTDSVTGTYRAERAWGSARTLVCSRERVKHGPDHVDSRCLTPNPLSNTLSYRGDYTWNEIVQWMKTVPHRGTLESFRWSLGNWALLSLESPLIKPMKPRKYKEGMDNMQGNSSLVCLRDNVLPF